MVRSARRGGEHVRGTGGFARTLSSVVCLIMFGAVTNGVFGLPGAPSPGDIALWWVVTLALALIVTRAFMIGVWVGPTRTRVRGWFLSIAFDNAQYRRVASVGYSGLLNEGNLDGSARFLKALTFLVQGERGLRQYYVAGLIASQAASMRQAQEIDDRITATRRAGLRQEA